LINVRFIKPLDEELLIEISKKYKIIYTLENNVASGGLGSSILEFYSCRKIDANVRIIGFGDSFIPHGDAEELYYLEKMDTESIFNKIMKE